MYVKVHAAAARDITYIYVYVYVCVYLFIYVCKGARSRGA